MHTALSNISSILRTCTLLHVRENCALKTASIKVGVKADVYTYTHATALQIKKAPTSFLFFYNIIMLFTEIHTTSGIINTSQLVFCIE